MKKEVKSMNVQKSKQKVFEEMFGEVFKDVDLEEAVLSYNLGCSPDASVEVENGPKGYRFFYCKYITQNLPKKSYRKVPYVRYY